MNYTSRRRALLYPSATAHPPIGKAHHAAGPYTTPQRPMRPVFELYPLDVRIDTCGSLSCKVVLERNKIALKQNEPGEPAAILMFILAWFYIEMLILMKYFNSYFSLYQVEFRSYSVSLLASPHLDPLCPSPLEFGGGRKHRGANNRFQWREMALMSTY